MWSNNFLCKGNYIGSSTPTQRNSTKLISLLYPSVNINASGTFKDASSLSLCNDVGISKKYSPEIEIQLLQEKVRCIY